MSRALGLHHATQQKKGFIQRIISWVKKEHTIDDIMIFIAVVYPLTILPQVIKIIQIQDSSSISAMAFTLKSLFAIPWIYYGVKHKNSPIILSNTLWFIGYVIIIAQTFYY